MKFHIVYAKKSGSIVAENYSFETFIEAEEWLENTGATYWAIGIEDIQFKEMFCLYEIQSPVRQ